MNASTPIKQFLIFLSVFIFSAAHLRAEKQYTLSGHIRDVSSGEALIGASVYIEKLGVGAGSNKYGFYSLTLPEGKYDLKFWMLGYETVQIQIDLNGDIKKDIELSVKPLQIPGKVVTSEGNDKNIRLPEMGAIKLNPSQIKAVPVISGEQDILKTMQLTPGVQGSSEGSSGFYVRGGGADQNLILLDEATVYNPLHLMGFFSVFNSDALKEATLYKGSSSAEYGGRLSSVLDLKMKEGNLKKYAGSAGIGLVASRLLFEGPIRRDNSSFFISGRRTYVDMFLKVSNDTDIRKSSLYFYDLNAKANYQLGSSDRLYISSYLGRDALGYRDEFGIDWGNATATMRWNHIFNDKLFSNSSLIYSLYSYQVGLNNGDELINIYSSIKNYVLKEDFEYFANTNNSVKFGLQATYHTLVPGEIKSDTRQSLSSLKIREKYALEGALYIDHEYQPSNLLSFDYGIRYSSFSVLGPGDEVIFDNQGTPVDLKSFGNGRLIKYYGGIEPRATVNYMLDDRSSLKASYARNRQYLHLLSTSTASTPFDLWHPSTRILKPGISDQVAIGYFRDFGDDQYETSLEVYYKTLQNQVDYKNGADIFLNKYVESELVFGKGRSYGLELYIRKKYGRLSGWLSYTLSKTQNKFAAIDNGSWFNARQDRTHDIALVGIYELNRSWTLSGAWIFMTGNAVTFPYGKYEVDGHVIVLYSLRNSNRMPSYHRLDLGATWKGKRSSWNISLYNAYGRKNAYAIDFRTSKTDPAKTEAWRIALFTFFPSVTYNIAF